MISTPEVFNVFLHFKTCLVILLPVICSSFLLIFCSKKKDEAPPTDTSTITTNNYSTPPVNQKPSRSGTQSTAGQTYRGRGLTRRKEYEEESTPAMSSKTRITRRPRKPLTAEEKKAKEERMKREEMEETPVMSTRVRRNRNKKSVPSRMRPEKEQK